MFSQYPQTAKRKKAEKLLKTSDLFISYSFFVE